MAKLDEASMVRQLQGLVNTQESIETISGLVQFHRKFAQRISELWMVEFRKAPVDRKLNLLYLANDVLQKTKSKFDDFIVAFSGCLSPAISEYLRVADDMHRGKLSRMIDIWIERSVMPRDLLGSWKSMVGGAAPASSARAAPAVAPDPALFSPSFSRVPELQFGQTSAAASSAAAPEPAAAAELLRLLREVVPLEDDRRTSMERVEKVDVEQAVKQTIAVRVAVTALYTSYGQQIDAELRKRQEIVAGLSRMIEEEGERIAELQAQSTSCTAALATLTAASASTNGTVAALLGIVTDEAPTDPRRKRKAEPGASDDGPARKEARVEGAESVSGGASGSWAALPSFK